MIQAFFLLNLCIFNYASTQRASHQTYPNLSLHLHVLLPVHVLSINNYLLYKCSKCSILSDFMLDLYSVLQNSKSCMSTLYTNDLLYMIPPRDLQSLHPIIVCQNTGH